MLRESGFFSERAYILIFLPVFVCLLKRKGGLGGWYAVYKVYIRLTTRGVLYSETIFMQTMLIYLRELFGFSAIENLHAIRIRYRLYNKFYTIHSSF